MLGYGSPGFIDMF